MTTRRCARCSRELPYLADLAAVATRTQRALEGMRLCLPDELTKGVRALASALPCYAGTCSPEDRR